ncbi:MAG TPA: adenosine deaminase [Terriglobales bacterium]
MFRPFRSLALVPVLAAVVAAQSSVNAEQRTAHYMESVRHQPSLLLAFLRDMPKGGDLHNHLDGAVYAEDFIDYAVASNLCVERSGLDLADPPCDNSCDKAAAKPAVRCAYTDQNFYNSLIDAWSMRDYQLDKESGHDHFFATFGKFIPAARLHYGEMIAKAAQEAAADHEQFLELMHTADGFAAADLGKKIGWDENLPQLRDKLMAAGIKDIAAATSRRLDADEAKMRAQLKCGTPSADPGCDVTVRYLYQVLRGLAPEQVFAQIVLGFELAQSDPRFVGLNLVMAEDWYISMRDFELQMKMFDYLHGIYPKVHLALHAGELAPGLVPDEGLTFHIRDSIERGHAERIGHGVDLAYEHDPIGLLHEIAERNVLVEICLTSNDEILNVKGSDHPFPLYVKYGVPVALATDDEGVSRGDLTHEYLRAVQTYDFVDYALLKRMARQSLEHSFLPGESLWADTTFRKNTACATSAPPSASPDCQKFLDASQRAKLQWKLESELADFEKRY